MSISIALLILFVIANSIAEATDYPTPGGTFDAVKYTTWEPLEIKGSRKGKVLVPFVSSEGAEDFVSFFRLDLVGDSQTRGFAHGALMANEIVEFTGPKLDKYLSDQVFNKDISQYPEPLQEILKVIETKGKLAAPGAFKRAMGWVWERESRFISDALKTEIKGISQGMCSVLGSSCNSTDWEIKLQQVNMLPELIKMACTAYGAWGKATNPVDGLVQLRALDFGSGPFSNYTIIGVMRNNPENPDKPFVSVLFPGWVGAITGISKSGVGISQKVWEVTGMDGMQNGSYNGEPDVFALRHILEYSASREEAESYLQASPRTWAIWIGIGDYLTKRFDLVGYRQNSSIPYTDVTMPSMTLQPYIESVAYVDKHTQPSWDTTLNLPTALQDFYGNITLETIKIIMKFHESGDHHIASYDYVSKEMYFAVGRINSNGDYGPEGGDLDSWCAYNRPYLKFSLENLWLGK